MSNVKTVLCKSLKLQNQLDIYRNGASFEKAVVYNDFCRVFGEMMASHFLRTCSNAEEMICGFDSDNLDKFIKDY